MKDPMEQSFRSAFCMMFLLTGFLQAPPVRECYSIDPGDLGLGFLEEVSCSGTMNFTSPVTENENEKCHVAALRLFIKGMQDAEEICSKKGNIEQTRETLEQQPCLNMNTTGCDFTMKVHQQFGQFVEETWNFVQKWNSIRSQ